MKLDHKDYCTHVENLEDRDILTRKLFDVNMRLFHANKYYRDVVLECFDYICFCSSMEKEGYKKPHGWSGANAGIPFNIIAIEHDGETIGMINPTMILGDVKNIVKSNCGSLTLDHPIPVERSTQVFVDYYDEDGKLQRKSFGRHPGFTIQHEIEHNQGILINNLQEVYRI